MLTAGVQSAAGYGQFPLSFEPNVGQTAPQVNYVAGGNGYALSLTPNEAVLSLRAPSASGGANQAGIATTLQMQLVGANHDAQPAGADLLAGTTNYLIGNDPSEWHTDVSNYGRVQYSGVYAGVDLAYYGNQQQLEYDFTVAPAADPGAIDLSFQGAQSVSLDSAGNLLLATAGGDVVEHAPVVYQQTDTGRQLVSAVYELHADGTVGFAVGAYDATQPLIIDPVLSYSTFLGGSGADDGYAIALDSSGNAYVAGETSSTNFPTMSPLQGTNGGGNDDAFVAKINAAGTALDYSTYLGGSGFDAAQGIAVDGFGNAYVTGRTQSTDFPTKNPLQAANAGGNDAFVANLNAAGNALVYSTYLGGTGDDYGAGITVDGSGNAYVTGYTNSTNFPTSNPLQPANAGGYDGFVTKLNAGGSGLVFSTYLGGAGDDSGLGIAADVAGNVFVTGETGSIDFPTKIPLQAAYGGGGDDAFVAKINAAGTALVYSTYLGGTGFDAGLSIAVDGSDDAYVTGDTGSSDFPTKNPLQAANGFGPFDAFVAKVNAAGSALVYSTYLGGSGNDGGRSIAVDGSGNAYVTGFTESTNFPTTNDAFQTALGGGENAFVAKLNTGGSALVYSTYLGGSAYDEGAGIAFDVSGDAYVTGWTPSNNFPTKNPLQASNGGGIDAFIAKLLFDLPLTGTPVTVSPTEGATFSGKVATFTDADPAGALSDFSATINWGDGSSSAGTISGPDAGGVFTVSGSHTYADEASGLTLAVTINDVEGASATTGSTVNVDDATLTDTSSTTTPAATEGASTGTLTVATFTDANPGDHHADMTATIHWGDNSTSTGTVTFSGGTYSVSGSRTYADEGSFPVTVDISDDGGSTLTGIGKSTVTVADATLAATGATIAATVGATFNGAVATFTDANPSAAPGDFSATIDWGDGVTTSGTIGPHSGGFTIGGTHTYSQPGNNRTLTVTISDIGGANTTTTSVVNVVSLPPTANPDTFVLGPGGAVSGSGNTSVLANDVSADGQPQNLTATLVSTTTNGTLTMNANGTFTYTPGPTFQGLDSFTYKVSEGTTVGNTVTVTLLSYHASLVDKLYNQVLHRSPVNTNDIPGLLYWTGQLDQGKPLDVVAQGIFNSPERLNPLVTNFYNRFLLRGTDPGGLAFWVQDWETTGDSFGVAASILGSPEFLQDAANTFPGQTANDAFVNLLYVRVLPGTNDPNGVHFWEGKLDSGALTMQQVADQIYSSPENHINLVSFLFGEYFKGDSQPPSPVPYENDLNNGKTQTQVELEIFDSTDYQNVPPEPAAGTVGVALFDP